MQQRLFLLAAVTCLLSACNFSAGVRKDLVTGLSVSHNGLSCDNFALQRNGQPLKDQDIRFGEDVVLLLEGVHGFTEKDGLIYPGMQLDVKDEQGKVVSSYTDMLADVAKSGVKPEAARVLRAAYQSGPPDVAPGHKYTMLVHVWDKQGKGTIDATLPLNLQYPDTTGLQTNSQGISATRTFLIADSGRIDKGMVPATGRVGINFQGLKGFTAADGHVFPGGSLTVYGADGKEMFNTGDAFERQLDGFTESQVKEGLRITVTLNGQLAGTSSTWKFRIWDKKGNGFMEATVPVTLAR